MLLGRCPHCRQDIRFFTASVFEKLVDQKGEATWEACEGRYRWRPKRPALTVFLMIVGVISTVFLVAFVVSSPAAMSFNIAILSFAAYGLLILKSLSLVALEKESF